MVVEEDDETGWKHLHGDVFRFPPRASLFASFVGAGTQLLLVAACLFALSLLGTFYPHNRGAMRTAGIVLYALTAGVAGYVSACWYRMLGGKRWAGNVILTAALFCGPLFLVFSFANSVAWVSGSTQALPFGTIVAILAVWALVTLPLTVLGGAAGKNAKSEYDAPCRTAKFPREIPPAPWYRTLPAQMIMAGFLPFSAIYIELHYVFASVFGHKLYVVYPILAIVFGLVVIVTAAVGISLTYFQLASEDHRWWWRSFFCGGSTAAYVFGYSVYYWFFRSDMRGLLQATFYYGYCGIACYGLGLMLGSVGFRASNAFVRRIYHEVKLD